MKSIIEHKARIKQDLMVAMQWMINEPTIKLRDQMVFFGGEASRIQPVTTPTTVRAHLYVNANEVKLFLNTNSHGDWNLLCEVIRESHAELVTIYKMEGRLDNMCYITHGQTWTEFHFNYQDSHSVTKYH